MTVISSMREKRFQLIQGEDSTEKGAELMLTGDFTPR